MNKLDPALSSLYGITAKDLIKTEHGSLNESYIVETDDKKYFLKRYFPEKQKGMDVQNTISVYEVLEKIEFGSFPQIIQNNDGKFLSNWKNEILVLTEFIEGEVYARRSDLTKESLESIGKTLGTLSKKTKGKQSDFPHVSKIDDRFWTPLMQYLTQNNIGEVNKKHPEFGQNLVNHVDEIKIQHKLYKNMKVKINNEDLVLVHGEPAVDNIIFRTPIDPILIDWDFSMFHVPEYNLKFYFFDGFKKFLYGYSKEFPLVVNKDRLAFAIIHQQNNLLLMFINQMLRNPSAVKNPYTPFKYYRSVEEIDDTIEKYV